jgi:hypothetical protein
MDRPGVRPVERVEVREPSGMEDLEQLSTAELERLVAQGRVRRLCLQVPPEPAEEPADVDGRVHVLPADAQMVDVHALLAVQDDGIQ